MSYRFVMGGSGSGKTYNIISECISDSIKNLDKKYVFLIPEQYSMQIQTQVVLMHPNHATDSIDVLTFKRLAYKVFAELGIYNPEAIDDSGKAMIIRRVASECKDELSMWKNQFDRPGHIDALKSAISELMQYGISPDMLSEVADKTESNIFKNKLSDLQIIYSGFKNYINKKYITNEEISDILVSKLPESKKLVGSTVVLCGFTGFTPVQYKLLEIILSQASEVIFEITIGDEENPYSYSSDDELFSMSKNMIKKIIDIGSKLGIKEDGSIRLDKRPYARFKEAPELDAFEKHFLRYDGYKIPTDLKGGSIRLLNALTTRQEIEAVSSMINKLVRVDGYRYNDIAIICADMKAYDHIIRSTLKQKEIPYYIDSNISIEANPLPELIIAILDCVSDDYSYDSISRLASCILIDDSEDIWFYMQNYMLELGITGYSRFNKTWEYLPRDLEDIDIESINRFRKRLCDILDKVRDCYKCGKAKVSDITNAIKEILSEENVEEKLLDIAARAREKNDAYINSSEYEKVYDEIISLLDNMDRLLGDELVDKDEYKAMLTSGLSQLSVGIIPACIDRVVVGDLIRTRLDDIKALFLVGACDGSLLKAKESGYVLTDRDKESLKSLGLKLSPTAKEDLYIQRYYIYRILTSPSKLLIISYASMAADGSSKRPSSLINQIIGLYNKGDIKIKSAENILDIYTKSDAEDYLVNITRQQRQLGRLDDKKGLAEKIIYIYKNDSLLKPKWNLIIDAAAKTYKERGIGRIAALKLFGERLKTSITRLESYSGCPFSHFASFGLGLGERREFSIEAADIGTLAHSILQGLMYRLKKEGLDLARFDDDTRKKYVLDSIDSAILDDEKNKYNYDARNRYIVAKLKRTVLTAAKVLAMQLSRGDFKPSEFELSFNARDGLDAMNIKLDGGASLELNGKIDRIDTYADSENLYIKLIDYKTGKTEWSLEKIIDGTQLQLAIYMDAALELLKKRNKNLNIVPAAMLYNYINNPIIDISSSRDSIDKATIDNMLLDALRPSGIVSSNLNIIKHLDGTIESGDKSLVIPLKLDKSGGIAASASKSATANQMDSLRKFAKERARQIGESILSGDIAVSPMINGRYTKCTYCPYRGLCRFDNKIDGYKYRYMPKLDEASAWKIINNEEE